MPLLKLNKELQRGLGRLGQKYCTRPISNGLKKQQLMPLPRPRSGLSTQVSANSLVASLMHNTVALVSIRTGLR